MTLALRLLIVLFWVILGIDCILIFNGYDEYRLYSKGLLMPVLYIIVALETVDTSHKRSKLIVSLILLFSLVGDLLLLKDKKDTPYFTYGLVSFLLVHILYMAFFLKIKRLSARSAVAVVASTVFIIAFLYFLLSNIWVKIKEDDLNVSVVIYSVSIGLMFISAVNTTTGKRAKRVAWSNFIPGALLFICSDSLLALGKFYPFMNESPDLLLWLNCISMFTYGAAQMLLISGAIKFIRK